MRHVVLVGWIVSLLSWSALAEAQRRGAPRSKPEPKAPAAESPASEEENRLRPPSIEPISPPAAEPAPSSEGQPNDAAGSGAESAPVEAPAAEPPSEEPSPSPAEANALLTSRNLSQSDPTFRSEWTTPQPILTLHGYFRVRGEAQDTFFLGRQPVPGDANVNDLPFGAFRPIEKDAAVGGGGCGSSPGANPCKAGDSLAFANMRLRLMPTLNLSEDVRIKMWVDVFDNVVLGSTPDSIYDTINGMSASAPTNLALDSLHSTVVPPQAGQNSLTGSIVARRAWAEVRNRDLGELRFGRMGFHWGLGMMYNDGANFDGDYSTDVDRAMVLTKVAGLQFMAAYDFVAEGLVRRTGITGVPYDAGQKDDANQYVLGVARRMDPEEQAAALAKGKAVLNAGAIFVHRWQLVSSQVQSGADPFLRDNQTAVFTRRNSTTYTPDIWIQFLYKKLRIEFEGAMVAGSIENTKTDGNYERSDFNILQFGGVLDAEYRLLDDKLGIYFNAGFASGDSNAEGLGWSDDVVNRASPSHRVTTFGFHPNYRVDLILWRNIMRRVAGAYYFRPGISYDFIRGSLGQLLGARVDLIWSRASTPVQTWGNGSNLGVELNGQLYYRSEDGPDLTDGFFAALQYGLLFPMQGLGYLEGQFPRANPGLKNAQTLRLLLGVMF